VENTSKKGAFWAVFATDSQIKLIIISVINDKKYLPQIHRFAQAKSPIISESVAKNQKPRKMESKETAILSFICHRLKRFAQIESPIIRKSVAKKIRNQGKRNQKKLQFYALSATD